MLRTKLTLLMLSAGISMGAIACGGNAPAGQVDPATPSVLSVENQSLNDMRIYVWRGGQRIRLGTVNTGQTADFKLPRAVLAGAASVRVLAEPIAGRRASISEEIMIQPGDKISMRILP